MFGELRGGLGGVGVFCACLVVFYRCFVVFSGVWWSCFGVLWRFGVFSFGCFGVFYFVCVSGVYLWCWRVRAFWG